MQGKSLWTNVLVAVVIAVAAFFAGAQWRKHTSASTSNALAASEAMPPSSFAPTLDADAEANAADSDDGDEDEEEAPPAMRSTGSLRVVINGQALAAEGIAWLQQFGPVRSGSYWYDPKSGLWGFAGHEPAGYVRPGLDFGTPSPRASNGDTGVFVNGREINGIELHWYELIFRTPSTGPGRFWLDGTTGNVGYEGNPIPLGNLIRSLQQSQSSAGGSQAFSGGSMVGVTNGDCTMVTTDSGYTAQTAGC
jgi:hypothetical protein